MDKTKLLDWLHAAGVRAIKTMAQTAMGMLTGDMLGLLDVDWIAVGSVALTAGIYSLLTSIAGLPELPSTTNGDG